MAQQLQLTLSEPDTCDDQASKILAYLKQGHTLTSLEALDRFQCFRLGARCWDLKKAGWNIVSEMVTLPNKKRIARYRLVI